MEKLDFNGMIAQSCRVMEVNVMKYTIRHTILRMGFWARVKPGKKNVVRSYNETLLYQKLYERQYDETIFGDAALWVSVKHFHTYFVYISEDGKTSDGKLHKR